VDVFGTKYITFNRTNLLNRVAPSIELMMQIMSNPILIITALCNNCYTWYITLLLLRENCFSVNKNWYTQLRVTY